MRRFSCATIIATLGLLLLTADGAFAIRGVKSLGFSHQSSMCLPDQALPCDPKAGLGESNIVYVHQREVNGQFVFDSLEFRGMPEGKMWLGINYAAQCKTGYRVEHAWVRTGLWDEAGDQNDPVAIFPGSTQQEIEHSGGKTIQNHLVNLQVPIQPAFDSGFLMHMDSAETVFNYGEAVVAARMTEEGQTEEEARAKSFEFKDWIGMHAFVRCKGVVFGREGWKSTSEWLPVTFVFVGLGMNAKLEHTPVLPEAPTDELTFGVAVTDAFLHVAPDASNGCRLRLTGAFTTNAPTEIEYRFIDELGNASQMFATTVDQTHVSMIDHYVDLPVVEAPDGEVDQLVIEQGGGFGEELVSAPTEREQGFYQIQVLEPHGYWSNVADFNVEPCRPSNTISEDLIQERTISEGRFPGDGRTSDQQISQEFYQEGQTVVLPGGDAPSKTGK